MCLLLSCMDARWQCALVLRNITCTLNAKQLFAYYKHFWHLSAYLPIHLSSRLRQKFSCDHLLIWHDLKLLREGKKVSQLGCARQVMNNVVIPLRTSSKTSRQTVANAQSRYLPMVCGYVPQVIDA